jgi:signal transduction histidine kinase
LLRLAPAAVEAAPQKNVLMLWGGRVDLPANVVVNQIIRERLHRELGSDVDLRFEHVEPTVYPARANAALRDFLRTKYAQQRFDLLIAIGDTALLFARSYAPELFPGVPIVGWGAGPVVEGWGSGPPFTAVVADFDAGATAAFIMRLQPETQQIVVVAGGSVYGDGDHAARARAQIQGRALRVSVTYLNGLPLEDVRQRLAHLPPRTVVLYLAMHGDGAGRRLVNVDTVASLAETTSVPIYGISASTLGSGIVGGVLFSQPTAANETADLAIRVLRGTRVEDIPLTYSRQVPMVDWRQLRRWHILEERLPPGTTVMNREPSLWKSYRWRIVGVLALCVGQGVMIAALLVQRTRRRRADEGLRRAEALAQEQRRELAHLGRVALLGELSGTLAHELNQPLAAILANAQAASLLLARDPPDLAEVQECLGEIVDSDKRASEIIQRLRAMLKRGRPQCQPVDLNEIAREVLGLAHSDLLGRKVTLVMDLAPEVPTVSGDRVQLQQVLLNLVRNGCDAMAETPVPERQLWVATRPEPDDAVHLLVADRGPGIPAGDLNRIFEPFVTSKSQGLGLGLSICRTIVSAHSGRLWATNNPDGGATLHVALPKASPPPPA